VHPKVALRLVATAMIHSWRNIQNILEHRPGNRVNYGPRKLIPERRCLGKNAAYQ